MIGPDLSRATVYVRPGATDMRKAANGLSIIVAEQMEVDPLGGALFVFCNRDRRILKGLWWDRDGFWLLQKLTTALLDRLAHHWHSLATKGKSYRTLKQKGGSSASQCRTPVTHCVTRPILYNRQGGSTSDRWTGSIIERGAGQVTDGQLP